MSPFATFVCLLIAVVCFALAAAKVPERLVNYVGLGLFFVTLPTFWAALEAL